MFSTSFCFQDEKRGEITVIASSNHLTPYECKDLCIEFYNDSMQEISFPYDEITFQVLEEEIHERLINENSAIELYE